MCPRKARRDLTQDEVIRQARHIARNEGEAALTMRRVAEACGVTPMATYRHVDDKEHLLVLMVDALARELAVLPEPGEDETAMDRIVDFGRRWRAALVREPVVLATLRRRPVTTEALALTTEVTLQLVGDLGLTGQVAAEATDALWVLTIGSASYDLSRPPGIRHALLDDVDPEQVPLTRATMDLYADRDGDERYAKALRRMLSGTLAEQRIGA